MGTWQQIFHLECDTVSIPSEDRMREADYFGLVSGKDADKFAASALSGGTQANGARSDGEGAPG